MTDATDQSLQFYMPSGKGNWLKFLAGFSLMAVISIFMAGCLAWVYEKGMYLIFLAPLFAAIPIVGMWPLVLKWSQCRNRTVAMVGSMTLAFLFFFSYYQIGLVRSTGLGNAHRIDLWPRYVLFRMETDVIRRGRHDNVPFLGLDPVQQGFNWLFFGLEFFCVSRILIDAGKRQASTAYCEPCGRWMKSETLNLPALRGAAIWESLKRQDYLTAKEHLSETSHEESPAGGLTLEHCPTCSAEARSTPVYLTVKGNAPIGMIVKQVELHPEEIGAFVTTFPGLKSTIGAHPNVLVEAQEAAEAFDSASKSLVDNWKGRLAKIKAVDSIEAGTILTKRNASLQTIIGLGSALGGIVLALSPTVLLFIVDDKPNDTLATIAWLWTITGLILSVLWNINFAGYPTSRFMRRQTRRAFDLRPNLSVDLLSKDLVFVDIIPRIHWGKAMMENATDIGFLELNPTHHALIFEGDRERYFIPIESILEVKHEFWELPRQQQTRGPLKHNYVIVVRAMTANGPWETWFYQRHNQFRRRNEKTRLADALALENRIRGLMQSA